MRGWPALCVLAVAAAAPARFRVDCHRGDDDLGAADPAKAAFRTVHAAVAVLRQHRKHHQTAAGASRPAAVVEISGLCELGAPLELSAADSDTEFRGTGPDAVLSGGTAIAVPAPAASARLARVNVDLAEHGFTPESLGRLLPRGYSGGNACIDTTRFEPSAAELFYRPVAPPGPSDGHASRMRVARFPNVNGESPATADWAKIARVEEGATVNRTAFALQGMAAGDGRLAAWAAELAAGAHVLFHGLWAWDWADSHRPVLSVDAARGLVTVGRDDVGRDVDPVHTGAGAQGGNVYAYNLLSELDSPGEYVVRNTTLSFIPPPAALPAAPLCSWNVSIGRSDKGGVWKTLRVDGVGADDTFTFAGCSAVWGPMGHECASMAPPSGPVQFLVTPSAPLQLPPADRKIAPAGRSELAPARSPCPTGRWSVRACAATA